MRRSLLGTATAIATVVTAVALAPVQAQDSEARNAQTQDTQGGQAQDKIDITTWNYAPLYEGWSAEEFLDADVYDQDGEEIGEVEDMVVTPEGDIRALVIEAGGFLDIGDTHFAYPWADARIVDLDRVEVAFDEDNIEDYSLFGDIDDEPVGPRNWRVTELLDDYARLGGAGFGWVDDVVISPQGQVQAVVVQPDVAFGAPGPYAWPYYGYRYGWEPGRDYYGVPYTEEEIAELEPFDYERFIGRDIAEDTATGADETAIEEDSAQ